MLLDRPTDIRSPRSSPSNRRRSTVGLYPVQSPSQTPMNRGEYRQLHRERPSPATRPVKRRSPKLPYPLKVAVMSILVATTGILSVEANRWQTSIQHRFAPAWLNAATPKNPLPEASPSPAQNASGEVIYNISSPPTLKPNPELQAIVDQVVQTVANEGLPTGSLSISVIDLKTNSTAGYQAQTFRYPASVAKLYWMVTFFAQIAQGENQEALLAAEDDLYRMMEDSDNTAASRIIDFVTKTRSGKAFPTDADYAEWARKREWLNRFFQDAGYTGLTLSQKNFPFDEYSEPQGRDRQLLKRSRNKATTEQTARLLYEIVNRQAISSLYSDEMLELLAKDLRPEVWKPKPNNPIQGFLGEGLPSTVDFGSKVGMTSQSRQDAAYVKTRDGEHAYILVVFGNHPSYANNWTIFPKISRLFFERVTGRTGAPPPTHESPPPNPAPPIASPPAGQEP
ncbi:MAG: serine hydrolase, partial [Leptolyngbyaceae cyanobacterium bins.59]|nr:serine hydrolase [Leptolyngbyaceae cyanobacterium bins.59]